MKYAKKGFVQDSVNAMLVLFIGIAVVGMIMIVSANLSAKVYSQFEDDINAITNDDVKDAVESSSLSGFTAMKDTSDFLPVVAIVVVVAIIITIFISVFYRGTVGGGMGGSAL